MKEHNAKRLPDKIRFSERGAVAIARFGANLKV